MQENPGNAENDLSSTLKLSLSIRSGGPGISLPQLNYWHRLIWGLNHPTDSTQQNRPVKISNMVRRSATSFCQALAHRSNTSCIINQLNWMSSRNLKTKQSRHFKEAIFSQILTLQMPFKHDALGIEAFNKHISPVLLKKMAAQACEIHHLLVSPVS